jgi:hypothetical protein
MGSAPYLIFGRKNPRVSGGAVRAAPKSKCFQNPYAHGLCDVVRARSHRTESRSRHTPDDTACLPTYR